ncbi:MULTISPECIES: lytic polysaccharide monooxygenase [Chryseobacterium]|uniref:Ig-like domain-containing protein n=1 Tax=Chryseobacterium geocarposphaerae TaxID=1416776 RepID=A0ABU1LEB6_9FLAO|nr:MULTISPECIES: lytic polysaccharide monooxygenase [Chryseobacterium]MDR6404960.1 hypothetical protein [Chryseobacterium geocarposphaerae]MDR6697743.1 hypothetical protein [Chryseobacterium ginsenosidimutans]
MPNPKHGHAFGTRGDFALQQNWLQEWNIVQFEGGKFFPTKEASGLDKYSDSDYPYDKEPLPTDRPVPPDDFICSGGWTNEHGSDWDIVNSTDDELESRKGIKWPKTTVSPGQILEIKWKYTAAHQTRGYNYWITKDGWSRNERITRDQLEPLPFHMHHYPTPLPDGAAPTTTSVVLPQKSGHHVMIVAWIISNTYHAFYQTFDLIFEDTSSPGPQVMIIPSEKNVEKGDLGHFHAHAVGEGPFTYLWSLPSGLTSYDNRLDRDNIAYVTENVTGDKTFNITCKVTDKNGNSTNAQGKLIVRDSSNPSLPGLIIMPNQQIVTKGSQAKFNASVTGGEGPFTYSWNLPSPLSSPDIHHNMSHITYNTDNVTDGQTFNITCTVTDRNNNTAYANAYLEVTSDTSEPGQCTDPTAGNYTPWNISTVYTGSRTHKISYKGLVWENKHHINAGELPPDINAGWDLISNIVRLWDRRNNYNANSYVNHNGSQWKARYYANAGDEPGAMSAPMWMRVGPEACEPIISKH